MPDIKDYQNENGLKHADAEKSGAALNPIVGTLSKQKKGDKGGFKVVKNDARKKLPVVVDIILALLIVVMVAGVVVGAFFAFRYFTVDYETVSVEYTVILDEAVEKKLKNESVYLDRDGNTYYLGKIKSSTKLENGSQIIVVSASARFRSDEGYSLGEERLAVGCYFTIRTGQNVNVSGSVVELLDKTNPRDNIGEKGGK